MLKTCHILNAQSAAKSNLERIAAAHNIPQIARIPIDPDFANQVDKGLIELFEGDWVEKVADAVEGA